MRNERRMLDVMLGVMEAAQSQYNGTGSNSAAIISEGLDTVRAHLANLKSEDADWSPFIGGHERNDYGLDLDELKAWSKRLNEASMGGWMKRGLSLRTAYVWQDGIQYDNVPGPSQGRGTNVQAKIDDPINQRAFFGPQARTRREKRLYTDGLCLWIGNDKTKLLEVVPLIEITDVLTDPDHEDIIYAYRRAWSRRQENGKYKDMVRWYFVDTYKDKVKSDYITVDGKSERIERGYTAFDMHANPVDGWKFGYPDALGAWAWNKIAKQLYMDGVDVSEAMATIIYTASATSGKGGQQAANQLATAQGAASSAVIGGGNTLSAMSTAGNAYDFSKLREIVAVIATSLDVSNIALTSNPGDAGSSYGSAATLDEPGRLTTIARRDEHIELDLRVLRWMAGSKERADKIKVYFYPLSDAAEQYRQMQTVTLPWLQGVITDDVYKEMVSDVLGVPDLGRTPRGMLLPNNKDSLARRDIDADGQGGSGASGSASGAASTASPTQGRSSGDGGGTGDERPTDVR